MCGMHCVSSVVAAVGRELIRRIAPGPKQNQRGKQILEAALAVSGGLGNLDMYTAAALNGRVERFRQLYYGDLIGVENSEVEAAMVRLGELLNQWKASPITKPEGFDDRVLELSAALVKQLNEEN